MLCICCDRMITYGDDDLSEEDAIFTEIDKGKYRLKAENRLWTGGVVGNISGGYGSIHDGSKYVIGICDDCVTLKLNEGKLSFTGNYMFDDPSIDKEVEKYKKIWRRNNNLSKL